MPAEPNGIAGRCGLAAVAILALGTVSLRGFEDAYRPEQIERWYYAATQQADTTSLGAAFLSAGSLLLVPWAVGLARALGAYSWPGAALAAGAATVHASVALLPFVVARMVPHGEAAIGITLLGLTLSGAALFSLSFGCGMLLLSLAMARSHAFPMWLSGSGLFASLLTMSAVSQAWSSVGADLVAISAPAGLAWVAITSWKLQRLKWESWDHRRGAPELNRLPLAVPAEGVRGEE